MFLILSFVGLLFIGLCNGDLPCNKVKMDYGYVCACNSTYCDTISPPKQLPPGHFHFYSTSQDNPGFNYKSGNFRMQAFSPYGLKYEVNRTATFQKIRGFGGSFTDSFGATLNTLSDKTQENLLKSFFSEDGVEYTVCRVVIASSDFSLRGYNYLPDFDPSMKSFNLTEDDYIYKIAYMKKAMNISKKKLNFFGSSWNSPEWMKLRNSSKSNYVRPEYRQLWADYYVKTLDSYRSEGIEFWALTTGNEPVTLFAINAVDVVIMFPEEQREWIIYNLGPALEKANHSAKIIVLDDMRVYAKWWMDTIMRDKRSEKYVVGVGLHYYMDMTASTDMLDIIHETYPKQEIIYTESSINVLMHFLDSNKTNSSMGELNEIPFHNISRGGPQLGSWLRGAFYATNIIENLNHWTTTYVDWNLALNEEGGPNLNGFPCDASIIVNETNDEFYKQPIFYAIGHFSKFIQPDANVIEVSFKNTHDQYLAENPLEFGDASPVIGPDSQVLPIPKMPDPPFSNDVQFVGAMNPNGSISVVFYNPKSSPVEIQLYDPERGYAYLILEPKSLNTFVYW